MELTSKSKLPRLVKERIIREYLSGTKTSKMLSEEYGMSRDSINKMMSRHKDKFLPIFVNKPILPAMKPKTSSLDQAELLDQNQELRRQLQQAHLKIEGYEIMGDILEEQYGIDLLKKAVAKQSPNSKNDTQK